jgi:hypothetical protein
MTAAADMPAVPFVEFAWQYLRAGWCPIPMPENAKWPPPDGFTGHHPAASGPDIQAWLEANSYRAGKTKVRPHNIALRMLPDQLGVDVDMYVKRGEEKKGRASLAKLEAQYGTLPPTLMSTARDDGSGIRFFRIPEGLQWPGAPEPGIELIQYGHRYAMAPPSINPETGTPYRWLWSDGLWGVFDGIPVASEISELPASWIEGLTGGVFATEIPRVGMDRAHGVDWIESHAGQQPMCPYMDKVQSQHVNAVAASRTGSRHDAGVEATQALIHLAAEGHTGVAEALKRVRAIWDHVTSGEVRPGEWERMIVGAVGVAAARGIAALGDPCRDPFTGRADRHTPRGGATVHVLRPGMPPEQPPTHDSSIWSARPELGHIQNLARTQMACPWSTLGVILARVVASIPPFVVLPPIVGGYGSLNSFYALVGKSGFGKGISESTAAMGFTIPMPADEFNAGSGEGLGHLFVRRKKIPAKEGGGYTTEQIRKNVLFNVAEVDSLTSLGQRQGSTLLPQLRQAWSGENLGFAYADPDKALKIEPHSYRLAMIVGVQPGRAAGILDDADGGTPQRFVWLTTMDPDISDEVREPPEPWPWIFPGPWKANARGRVVMDVPDHVKDEIRKGRATMVKDPDSFGLDTHFYYAKLKVAGAFALLASRAFINSEDWELAGELMRVSLAERAYVQRCLAAERASKAVTAGMAEGHKQLTVDDIKDKSALQRVSQNLIRKASSQEWRPVSHFQRSIVSRDRSYIEEALENLVNTGMLEVQEMQIHNGISTLYRLKMTKT